MLSTFGSGGNAGFGGGVSIVDRSVVVGIPLIGTWAGLNFSYTPMAYVDADVFAGEGDLNALGSVDIDDAATRHELLDNLILARQ